MVNRHSKFARIAVLIASAFAATGCGSVQKPAPLTAWEAPVAVELADLGTPASFHVFTKTRSAERVCLQMHSTDPSVALPTAYSAAHEASGFHPAAGIVELWSNHNQTVCYDTIASHRLGVARQEVSCVQPGTATIVVRAFTTGPDAADTTQQITVTCEGSGSVVIAANAP